MGSVRRCGRDSPRQTFCATLCSHSVGGPRAPSVFTGYVRLVRVARHATMRRLCRQHSSCTTPVSDFMRTEVACVLNKKAIS
ncbi:hypothetical protein EVAR_88448_1 [Eumeta japonica]|uniref:Uncharacterized protein n=1 Tax=Eumeta variegata TaxID=151549 RepID=A0A4C1SIX6_EUMVA|nr:hypothetical protein EVAR_88448_1 [Eumeta japonica]